MFLFFNAGPNHLPSFIISIKDGTAVWQTSGRQVWSSIHPLFYRLCALTVLSASIYSSYTVGGKQDILAARGFVRCQDCVILSAPQRCSSACLQILTNILVGNYERIRHCTFKMRNLSLQWEILGLTNSECLVMENFATYFIITVT